MFRDRNEAAARLADSLLEYRGQNPLILAIPRGAVPMAKLIAQRLQGELDVVLVRKLGAPDQPELAIGSVDESGWTYVADFAGIYGADSRYIESEKQAQLQTIRERRAQYTPVRAPIDPAGRVVIVIDDMQWSDADSHNALSDLLAPPRAPPLLVVLAAERNQVGSPSPAAQVGGTAAARAFAEHREQHPCLRWSVHRSSILAAKS